MSLKERIISGLIFGEQAVLKYCNVSEFNLQGRVALLEYWKKHERKVLNFPKFGI